MQQFRLLWQIPIQKLCFNTQKQLPTAFIIDSNEYLKSDILNSLCRYLENAKLTSIVTVLVTSQVCV